jgi:hypothetical protein
MAELRRAGKLGGEAANGSRLFLLVFVGLDLLLLLHGGPLAHAGPRKRPSGTRIFVRQSKPLLRHAQQWVLWLLVLALPPHSSGRGLGPRRSSAIVTPLASILHR